MRKYLELIEEVRKIDPRAADFLNSKDARKIGRFRESSYLSSCFHWRYSPQGYGYWREICDRLPEHMGWR